MEKNSVVAARARWNGRYAINETGVVECGGHRRYLGFYVRNRVGLRTFNPLQPKCLDWVYMHFELKWSQEKYERMCERIKRQNAAYREAMRKW